MGFLLFLKHPRVRKQRPVLWYDRAVKGERAMYITTVTVNPCIDRTIQVDRVTPGHSHRIQKTLCSFRGKGINVSLALNQIEQPVKTVCLCHSDGEANNFFKENRLNSLLIPVPGKVRVNIKLFEQDSGRMTEFNEKGEPMDLATVDKVLLAVNSILPTTALLVLAGSVPPGFPDTFYYELGMVAQEAGVPFLLDASGELMRQGMKASPLLIKPNEEEFLATFGIQPAVTGEFCRVYRDMLDKHGISYGAVSMGEKGALLVTPTEAWFSEPVKIDVQGVQGAGDSMVAGFAAVLAKGNPSGEEMLRTAVACAHASLELPGTQMCTMEGLKRRLPLTPVTRLCTL